MDEYTVTEVAYKNGYNDGYAKGFAEGSQQNTSVINKIPTEDVVEVVRCKDCKFRNDIIGCNTITGCKEYVRVSDNFYCANGERRDNDE